MSRKPIGPTPERLAKAGGEFEEFTADRSENWRAIRMLDGHPLESWLKSRKIDADQYEAGTLFRSDWEQSGQANSGVIDPSRVIVDGGQVDFVNDISLDAQERFKNAVQAIGLVNSMVLTDCILLEHLGVEDIGRKYRRYRNPKQAKQAGQDLIWSALKMLEYHYYGKRRDKREVRASHAPDYRPAIDTEDQPS